MSYIVAIGYAYLRQYPPPRSCSYRIRIPQERLRRDKPQTHRATGVWQLN